jgi:hypothetical protein
MIPINEHIIFIINEFDDFTYKFSIVNEFEQSIYQKLLDRDTNFYIDIKQNYIKWLDLSETQSSKLLLAKFDQGEAAINLKFLIHQCLFQSNSK